MNILKALRGSALIAGLLVGASGCELITSPDRSKIDGGGGAGGTTATGGTTGGSTGGMTASGGTTGGGGAMCTPVDDGKECTDDVCENGSPVSNNKTVGTACAEGGGAVCDGAGNCVVCIDDTNCTQPQVCNDLNACVDPACDDGKLDGSETDVDCGGSCSPAAACADLKNCAIDADCMSGVCADNGSGQLVCQPAACDDTVQNGSETDVDCGGSCAPANLCADLLGCAVAGDCQSGVCKDDGSGALKCAVPACGDGVQQMGEACDDGNQTNDDGCDDGPNGTCKPTGCGNGTVSGTEVCDDGNNVDGDGCDNNCTVTACGNGIQTTGETCDDANTADNDGCSAACAPEPGYTCNGAPSVCSTTCGDGTKAGAEACDDDNVADADGCSATCAVETGWDCTGAPLSSCAPICGDGLLKGNEACDDDNTAASDGCSATCTIESGYLCMGEPSVCMTVCGDGVQAGAEACDDNNMNANDGCTGCVVDNGYSCSGSPSVCTTVCGDNKIVGAETCDDGNANNGDGCSSACGVEQGFNCSGLPSVCTAICGDGLKKGAEACDDNNVIAGDGCSATCAVESGYTCTPASPSVCTPVCGDGVIKPGEACDDSNVVAGDCCSPTCQIEAGCEVEPNNACGATNTITLSGAPAVGTVNGFIKPLADADFFAFTLATRSSVRIETFIGGAGQCTAATGSSDSQIELRAADCTTVLINDDDDGPGFCSLVDPTVAADAAARALAPNTYYVKVYEHLDDGLISSLYQLKVSVISTCGNGTTEPSETCDDNNFVAGDGCSATCQTETGYACTGTPSVCALTCGNGTLQAGETCDDNNTNNNDGCSSLCTTEAGFTCTGTPSVCTVNCGNGTIQTGEVCDDNNTTNGDGCSSFCQVQPGYTCTGTPSVCTLTCGNGAANAGEGCDDSNTTAGDGCSATCQVEPGFTCTTAPSTCTNNCGNGAITGNEQCDDNNTTPGDGCSATCQIEAPFTCTGAPSACVNNCGNQAVTGSEQCDDGNVVDSDGCSATCQWETTAEVEPNGSQFNANANAVQITGSAVIAGSLTQSIDKDVYRINLPAAKAFRFEIFDPSGKDCIGMTTTTLTTFDANFVQLKTDINGTVASGIGVCAALVQTMPAGISYVQIGGSAAQGSYLFQIKELTNNGTETEPNGTLAEANTEAGYDFVLSATYTSGEQDWYKLTLPVTASIRAEIIDSPSTTCESFGIDTKLDVMNAAGSSIAFDDDDGRGFCSAIDGTGNTPRDAGAHNLAAGTYYLRVTGYSTTADYRLGVTIR